VIVTKGASIDDSVIIGHEDDDEIGDNKIVYVPAMDHKKGSKRPVYKHSSVYPRYVGTSRGPAYNIKGYPDTKPLGYIDEVEHTYAYFDANYGVMNEHQLSIGEATCASNYYFEPNKDRIFTSDELSRVALERCKKAKDAVILMGELAEKYGYYGWGEILLIGDTKEAWVFELSCTPHGKSALWVAKKVPDGEVFVNANIYKIREVDPSDPNMLYSSNLFQIAKENNWYDPNKEHLDWLKAVSPGEYDHPYYSLRRVWRLQSRVNPNLNLSPWAENAYTKQYAFSIKPKNKMSVKDVIALFRDHYEGTEFDMTKGLAAGPFGNPSRFTGDYDLQWNLPGKKKMSLPLEGAWERAISDFDAGYVHVKQSRGYLPDPIGGVMWLGLDAPYTTCFMPFYVGINNLPRSIEKFTPQSFELDEAWWHFNFVANWAILKFDYMKKDIQKKQEEIENHEFAMTKKLENKALALYKKSPRLAKEILTNYCNNNTQFVLHHWWDLARYLIAKYTDGYQNIPKVGQNIGYPKKWRDKVGYQNGPKSYEKPKDKK